MDRSGDRHATGQAGAELRARLQQRLVMIEGCTGGSVGDGPETAQVHSAPVPRRAAPKRVGSPPHFKVPMPRLSVPQNRNSEPPIAKAWLSARVPQVVPPRTSGGGERGTPQHPYAPTPAPPSVTVSQRAPQQSQCTAAQAGPVISTPARGTGRALQTSMNQSCSPKGSRLLDVTAASKPLVERPSDVEIGENWPPPKSAVEVSVDEFRMLPPDRVTTRNVTVQLHRTSEVTNGDMRPRKVSCGKLYEELAQLRYENQSLSRQCSELEQKTHEEFNQQLTEELALLRHDNKVVRGQNVELQKQNAELDQRVKEETAARQAALQGRQEALAGTAGMERVTGQLDELRQRQEAELERTKDHLGILLHQNEKLSREVDELRRERKLHHSNSIEHIRKELQAARRQNETLTREADELRQSFEERGQKNLALTREIEELKHAGERQATELTAAIKVLRGENSGLRQAKDLLEQEAQRRCGLAQENQQLTSEVSQLRMEQQRHTLECKHVESESLALENQQLLDEVSQLRMEQERYNLERENMESETLALKNQQLLSEVSQLRMEQERCNLERKNMESETLRLENQQLLREVSQLRMEQQHHDLERKNMENECKHFADHVPEVCSASRLRAVMTDKNATQEELKQAIAGAEALMDEARRELAAKQLRTKRACFEKLHAAIECAEEPSLEEAINNARHAELDAEDIAKAEAKLEELRARTDDQRAAKAAHELNTQRKKHAFLLVKRDDADALQELIEGLEEGIVWQEWKDYMGRTMWRFSMELRSTRVQRYLAPFIGCASPARPQAEPQECDEPAETPTDVTSTCCGSGNTDEEQGGSSTEETVDTITVFSEAEEAEFRAKAFRSVVQDNIVNLGEVLDRLPLDTWSKWQNKAGKDLLTLSQERGSTQAYSVLAKALGLVQEMRRDSFEERETVWIFVPGEVQPLRATVLEDTPEEADEVLVEYWDGDAPPSHVERCLVRKTGG